MCGRFALTAPASTIAEIFAVDVLPDLLPRYNIAPTTEVLVVVQQEGQRVMQTLRWGLIPTWAKDKKIAYQTLNARAESVSSKPAFRSAFKRRRCLILADAFYEWHREGKTKIPHLIGMGDGRPFAIAGLWERWFDPENGGEEVRSCAIVTTGPNELMTSIHDRMPVILAPENWDRWLDPTFDDKDALQELLVPFPSDAMAARRTSQLVGNVKNKGPEVQGPWQES